METPKHTPPLGEADYYPIRPIASFVDQYGDEQIIHRPQGNAMRVYKGCGTSTMKINRAISHLMGALIKKRRTELGLSQRELCTRAGFADNNPKQRIHALENPSRSQGVRLGTLFALAHALECLPQDLLPSLPDALEAAGVAKEQITALSA